MENKTGTNINVIIRIAEPKDVEEIQDVFYQSWLATYPKYVHEMTEEDVKEFFKDAFKEETLVARRKFHENPPENKKFVVALVENKVVGLCSLTISEESNRIQTFYILPEFIGKGIGRKLFEEIQKYFNKSKPILVCVAKDNSPAIKFYEAMGFKKNSRIVPSKFKMPITGTEIEEIEMEIINK